MNIYRSSLPITLEASFSISRTDEKKNASSIACGLLAVSGRAGSFSVVLGRKPEAGEARDRLAMLIGSMSEYLMYSDAGKSPLSESEPDDSSSAFKFFDIVGLGFTTTGSFLSSSSNMLLLTSGSGGLVFSEESDDDEEEE